MNFVWTETPTQAEWEQNAVLYYQNSYSFREKSEEEMENILRMRKWCAKHLPGPYTRGVYLLAEGAAHLGEDIVVVDGLLQHPIHVPCQRCLNWVLVSRDTKDWCTYCQGIEDLRV